MRKLLAMWVALACVLAPTVRLLAAPRDDDGTDADTGLVTVEVTGLGMTEADAVNDALRKAVEEGAGTLITS